MKKLILFVDDEPNILQGMKRMLRSMRKEYKMFFAEGGKQALELMAREPVDVVVSDMRMPGMDGAQLLSEVRDKYPDTVRLMLTGQADEDSILKTVGIVHQFLAKPCDPEKLKELLTNIGELRSYLASETMRKVVSRLDSLPSLPKTYLDLQEALQDPDIAISEVAKIIERDLAMSAKVLQLVNSAFFGLFAKVKSPAYAVNLLGLSTIKTLVLGFGVFSSVKKEDCAIDLDQLWNHSLMVGRLAKRIAEEEGLAEEKIDNCFMSGILHDLGKLVLAMNFVKQYREVLEESSSSSRELSICEKEALGACHGDVGAYLLGLWGFRHELIHGVGYHHNPLRENDGEVTIHAVVSVADALCNEARPNPLISGYLASKSAEIGEKFPFSSRDCWGGLCEEVCMEDTQEQ